VAGVSIVRKFIRLTNLYATPWHIADGANTGDLTDYLQIWRFAQYYRLSADQLPRVLGREMTDPESLSFKRWSHSDLSSVKRLSA